MAAAPAGPDDDNDGIQNDEDNCPASPNPNQLNADNDGQGDVCDNDDDNDGIPDDQDAFPLDASESVDTDGDGIGSNIDNCPLVSNSSQLDTDGDDLGNACDPDDDGDGVLDAEDDFPSDPAESIDTDGDGLGNNVDSDDDGDGMPDSYEIDNGLDPLNIADGGEDMDGDGFKNFEEYKEGSDPQDSSSVPGSKALPWLQLLLGAT